MKLASQFGGILEQELGGGLFTNWRGEDGEDEHLNWPLCPLEKPILDL